MRIAYVTAGAAGMYCGTCMHDNTLAAAMRRAGHDVALIPTYTPMRTDEDDVSVGRVFYGAINVYLEQKTALFRHTPRVVDRLFRNRALLDWAVRAGASSNRAEDLGPLTLSVLEGEDGKQVKELDELVAFLRDTLRPDVVHLSNSLMAGMARRIRAEVGVPVVCSVQGEDLFVEHLKDPWRERIVAALRARARDVDAFVAPSGFYVDVMAALLDAPAERFHRVGLGLNLEGHGTGPAEIPDEPFTIGYLARICPEKGLHLLAAAFRHLAGTAGRERVRLRVAGYLGEADRAFADGVRDQIAAWGLDDRVEWVGEVDRAGKIAFLRSLHVLSVPAVYREPKGLYVLEALANGVPVVQPDHGSFPEMIASTRGGILVAPDSAEALSAGLASLLDDPERRRSLGREGQRAVRAGHSDEAAAAHVVDLYRRLAGERSARPA